jgi:predicted Zn-dependent protease
LVEYDDGTFDFFTRGEKRGMGSVKALADEFGISMEEAAKIKMMEPEDQILEIERMRKVGVPSYKDKDKRLIPDDLNQESVDLAIAKGEFEKKYSGLIDPKLMKIVLNDPSLESVKKLDALIQEELTKSKRKLNASGGLNYLMGM